MFYHQTAGVQKKLQNPETNLSIIPERMKMTGIQISDFRIQNLLSIYENTYSKREL